MWKMKLRKSPKNCIAKRPKDRLEREENLKGYSKFPDVSESENGEKKGKTL